MYGSSENQELHALYQFGQPDSTTTRRATDQEPTSAANEPGGDSAYHNNAEEESYSPMEGDMNHGMPASPAAFGGGNDTYVPTGNNNVGSYGGSSFEVAADKEHHKGGSKKSVLKKMLGTDKKNTKHMTDEEKKAYQLQERWKNANLEEQRLNELESRVNQEETWTAAVGQAPNFPPKFLCIKPLVYHKITAVAPERQLFVTMAFWDWVAVCIILVANCPITIACNYTHHRSDVIIIRNINIALNFVLSCVYLIGIPLAFLAWYWPIYESNYKLRPTQHVLALSGLLIALAQAIFAFVGPESYGFCGILSTRWIARTRAKGVVVPMAIVTALWGLQALFTCYMIFKEFRYYRHDLAVRRAQRRQQAMSGN